MRGMCRGCTAKRRRAVCEGALFLRGSVEGLCAQATRCSRPCICQAFCWPGVRFLYALQGASVQWHAMALSPELHAMNSMLASPF